LTSVFRPTYKDKAVGETRESAIWWYEFTFIGNRIRESAKTARKTIAINKEKKRRLALESSSHGVPSVDAPKGLKSVADLITSYLHAYELDHRIGSSPSSLRRPCWPTSSACWARRYCPI